MLSRLTARSSQAMPRILLPSPPTADLGRKQDGRTAAVTATMSAVAALARR
jgi:hypothetical protein